MELCSFTVTRLLELQYIYFIIKYNLKMPFIAIHPLKQTWAIYSLLFCINLWMNVCVNSNPTSDTGRLTLKMLAHTMPYLV